MQDPQGLITELMISILHCSELDKYYQKNKGPPNIYLLKLKTALSTKHIISSVRIDQITAVRTES